MKTRLEAGAFERALGRPGPGLDRRRIVQVLIAGASGFLGQALARGADRAPAPGAHPGPPAGPAGTELEWHPERGELDPDLLRGYDAVIGLSGAGIGDRRWTAGYKRELLDSRVQPTGTLAGALAHLPAGERPATLPERLGDRLLRRPGRRGAAGVGGRRHRVPGRPGGAVGGGHRAGRAGRRAGGDAAHRPGAQRQRRAARAAGAAVQARRSAAGSAPAGSTSPGSALADEVARSGSCSSTTRCRAGQPDRPGPGAQRRVQQRTGPGAAPAGAAAGARPSGSGWCSASSPTRARWPASGRSRSGCWQRATSSSTRTLRSALAWAVRNVGDRPIADRAVALRHRPPTVRRRRLSLRGVAAAVRRPAGSPSRCRTALSSSRTGPTGGRMPAAACRRRPRATGRQAGHDMDLQPAGAVALGLAVAGSRCHPVQPTSGRHAEHPQPTGTWSSWRCRRPAGSSTA